MLHELYFGVVRITCFKDDMIHQRSVTQLYGGPDLMGAVATGHLGPPQHWVLSVEHTHTRDQKIVPAKPIQLTLKRMLGDLTKKPWIQRVRIGYISVTTAIFEGRHALGSTLQNCVEAIVLKIKITTNISGLTSYK